MALPLSNVVTLKYNQILLRAFQFGRVSAAYMQNCPYIHTSRTKTYAVTVYEFLCISVRNGQTCMMCASLAQHVWGKRSDKLLSSQFCILHVNYECRTKFSVPIDTSTSMCPPSYCNRSIRGYHIKVCPPITSTVLLTPHIHGENSKDLEQAKVDCALNEELRKVEQKLCPNEYIPRRI